MNCKICNTKNKAIFSATILNKYKVDYFYCTKCGFLQTEEPYWLSEAYSESINMSDTGYMQRNLKLSRKLTILLSILFKKDAKFLDYGGGCGVFVRLMRDIGFDFYWADKHTKNIIAKGFEYNHEKIEALTAFECFEHFKNPLEEIEKMLKIAPNIIFTTKLLNSRSPNPISWWYYSFHHGQHISFYSKETMEFIAKKYGLNFYSCYGIHILSEKKVPRHTTLFLTLSWLGLHHVFSKKYKSKTKEDCFKMQKLNR